MTSSTINNSSLTQENIEQGILAEKSKYERIKQSTFLAVGTLVTIIGGLHLAIDELRVELRGKQVPFPTDKIIGWSLNIIGACFVGLGLAARHKAQNADKELRGREPVTPLNVEANGFDPNIEGKYSLLLKAQRSAQQAQGAGMSL